MKNSPIVAVFLLLSSALLAQDKVNALTAPTSPASSILGMQPGTILTPKSFKALEAALYSNFSDGNGGGVIPDDFGLEFTPYWFTNHGLGLKEYFHSGIGRQILFNSSFSIASSQNFLLQDSTRTKTLALGYRTSVFFGSKSDYTTINNQLVTSAKVMNIRIAVMGQFIALTAVPANNTKDAFILGVTPTLLAQITSAGKSAAEAQRLTDKICSTAQEDAVAFNPANKDLFFAAFLDIISEKLEEGYEKFKDYLKARDGLTIDFAYASFLNFPTNDFEYSIVPRQSIWLTPSYRFVASGVTLKALAVYRYEWYNKKYFTKYFPASKIFESNNDFGVAIEGQLKKFTLQFEGTYRSSKSEEIAGIDANSNILYFKKTASDSQYIGKLTYLVTPAIALSYQIGSGFKPVFSTTGTLISLLSVNFGFGGPKVVNE